MNLRHAIPILILGAAMLGLGGCAQLEQSAIAEGTPTGSIPAAPSQTDLGPGGIGPDDGFVPFGETVSLDDDVPAISNLDAVLRDALERAAIEASERDVVFTFTDAWRSAAYQQQVFDDAVLKYGSEEEARRWTKPADESRHVTGEAVDLYSADAMDWLTRFGATYGLCQIYANESWHYEYVDEVTERCPGQLPDSSFG